MCVLNFANHLVFRIKQRVRHAIEQGRTLRAINHCAASPTFYGKRITAAAFPRNTFSAGEFPVDGLCVRRLPAVLKMKTPTNRCNLQWIIDAERPATHIDFVSAIIERLTRSPMPKPMPIV